MSDATKQAFNQARHRWLNLVAGDRELTRSALAVAIVIWACQNVHHRYAWPSLGYIATRTRISRASVLRGRMMLAAHGWITVRQGRRGRSNQYRLAFGRDIDDEVDAE